MKKYLLSFSMIIIISNAFEQPDNFSLLSSNKIYVSKKCYNDWLNIQKDATQLYYFFKGIFIKFGKLNCTNKSISTVLKFIKNKKSINIDTNLRYMPIARYMSLMLKEEKDYRKLDKFFIQKSQETKNTELASEQLCTYFVNKHIKKALNKYGQYMFEKDSAKIILEEQGIFLRNKTVIFNENFISNNPEDQKKVRDALNKLMILENEKL